MIDSQKRLLPCIILKNFIKKLKPGNQIFKKSIPLNFLSFNPKMTLQSFVDHLESKILEILKLHPDHKHKFGKVKYNPKNFFCQFKIRLIIFNSGKTLSTLKKISNFLDSRSEVIKQMMNSVLSLKENSLIHNDIKLGNMCYKSKSRTHLFKKNGLNRSISRTKNVRKSFPRPNFKNSQRIQPKKPKFLESDNKIAIKGIKGNLKLYSTKNPRRRNFHRIASMNGKYFSEHTLLEKKTGKIKLIDFGLSKNADYNIFREQIRINVNKLKNYAEKTDLKLDNLDPSFCFYTELKYLINQKNDRVSGVSSLTSSIISHMKKGNDELEISDYIGCINTHFLNRNDNSNLEIETEPRVTLIDNLKYFFDDFEYKKNLRIQSEDLTGSFQKEWNRLKRKPIRGTLKYASILSFLKIKPNFLFDIESMYYSIQEFLGTNFGNSTNTTHSRSLIKNTNINLFESEKNLKLPEKDIWHERNLLSEQELDTLISILCITQKSQFGSYECAIEKIFNLQTSKKRLKRMLHSKTEGKYINFYDAEIYLTYSEVNRFKILKTLLRELQIIYANDPGELLNLKATVSGIFREKVNMYSSLDFRFLPPNVKKYFVLYQKMFYHFLISFMFSADVHFLHKFLVIFTLQAFLY